MTPAETPGVRDACCHALHAMRHYVKTDDAILLACAGLWSLLWPYRLTREQEHLAGYQTSAYKRWLAEAESEAA